MNRQRALVVAVAAHVSVALVLSGCATAAFVPADNSAVGFVQRAVSQQQDGLRLSAAVLGPSEVEELIGLDLYSQGIQPLWLQATNTTDEPARIVLWSIDDQYFSPLEVAWTNRKQFKRADRPELERWFFEHGMPRRVPAGESRSGFVFTHATNGTKGFNVDVYISGQSKSFTFFAPLPGFTPDYMQVDFESLYAPDEVRTIEPENLQTVLEQLECCSTDASGTQPGAPFNVVLVGTGTAVRRALLRAGWEETEADSPDGVIARTHYFRDREPDGTFHWSRPDGSERKELRLWLAPMRVDADLVWLGQASYDMGGANGLYDLSGYRIDPDYDDASFFVMQNFWYSQSLARMGVVDGVPAATIDSPRRDFNGARYFTSGQRVVLFVSETPVAMDETILLNWAEPAVP